MTAIPRLAASMLVLLVAGCAGDHRSAPTMAETKVAAPAARPGSLPERDVAALSAVVPLPANMPAIAASVEDRQCLAKTIYFESKGQPEIGQEAVAAAVINRVRHPEFPKTICGVVQQGGERRGCQFSWWCDGRSDEPTDLAAWATALQLADVMIDGKRPDASGGALFFHHTSVNPDWTRQLRQTAAIGDHLFYR